MPNEVPSDDRMKELRKQFHDIHNRTIDPKVLKALCEGKCTKVNPWDGKTHPIEHVDADFVGDTNMLLCPNCGYCWSLGPDV